MASPRERSSWPLLLFLGFGAALLLGGAAAVAEPSDSGRPWWHEREPQRVTGTVVGIDEADGTLLLEGLVSYDPVRAGIGTLTVEGADLEGAGPGDTVDVVLRRVDGTWVAEELVLLDPD